MSKTLIDKRLLTPTYVYVYNGLAYTNAPKLCKELGLSYSRMKNIMLREETLNIYVKYLHITKNKEGRTVVYKNGKYKIKDLDDFCEKLSLDKKVVLAKIKANDCYKHQFKITRHKKYAVKISYEIDDKLYPAGSVLPTRK